MSNRRAPHSNLLRHLEGTQESLSRSGRKVAELVLARPHFVLNEPLAQVAREADVSEPTVIRFCRALGCSGFQDFRLRLAQSLGSGMHFVHADVSPDDPVEDMAAKVFDRAASTLLQVRAQLDAPRLERAIRLLAGARRIECYGLGSSGIVAADAQHKLFRLGIPCVAYSDAHVHGMAATMLRAGDVVLAFSVSGRTLDLLSSVELARESGASVVSVTALGSPLAARSTVALEVAVDEDTELYTPMTSRLAHLAIVDVLAVGVALRQGPRLRNRLERAKASLRDKRVRGFN